MMIELKKYRSSLEREIVLEQMIWVKIPKDEWMEEVMIVKDWMPDLY